MDLLQRWLLCMIITIINVELFNLNDFQFWFIAAGIGLVCSPLHKKDRC